MSVVPEPSSRGSFAATRWSVVLAAGDPAGPGSRDAREILCRTYWPPLYAFARRRGGSATDAEDQVQGFFADFLDRGATAGADPDKGPFRAWILGAFKHYLAREREKAGAARRGGGRTPVPFDTALAERRLQPSGANADTPERAFERAWALALLDAARRRLRADYAAAGQERVLDRLEAHIGGPGADAGHAAAARDLGLSEAAVRVAAHRLRRRFGEVLRDEVAATLPPGASIGDEIRALLALFSPDGR